MIDVVALTRGVMDRKESCSHDDSIASKWCLSSAVSSDSGGGGGGEGGSTEAGTEEEDCGSALVVVGSWSLFRNSETLPLVGGVVVNFVAILGGIGFVGVP